MGGGIFVSVNDLPASWNGWLQLAFLGAVYTYIVINGCIMIGEGSELLELTKYGPLVGPTILPVLGAVPDGAIVLFSGIGSDAQTQLETGVGALAGSTVMLLTIPWILCIIGGRVDLDDEGKGMYKANPKLKNTKDIDIFKQGVSLSPKGHKIIWTMAIWMLVTAVPFLIVQIPTFVYLDIDDDEKLASLESYYVLAGFIVSTLMFFAYIVWSYFDAMGDGEGADDKRAIMAAKKSHLIAKAIKEGKASLTGAIWPIIQDVPTDLKEGGGYGSGGETKGATTGIEAALDRIDTSVLKDDGGAKYNKLRDAIRPFFNKYSGADGDVDSQELGTVFQDMGEQKTAAELKELFAAFDKDHSGTIELDEFVDGCAKYVLLSSIGALSSGNTVESPVAALSAESEQTKGDDEDDDEDEDEDEIPEEFAAISDPNERQQRIIKSAMGTLTIGTLLVLVFSDPLVDVIDALGDRTGISSFYLAFILAPLITNGSELYASYTFAKKKTTSSITCSLQQLFGAAIMNNTYCLLIFYALIYFQDLYWAFSAETLAILFVEIAMMYYAWQTTHRIFDAIIVVTLYPLCLVLVFVLETYCGLD